MVRKKAFMVRYRSMHYALTRRMKNVKLMYKIKTIFRAVCLTHTHSKGKNTVFNVLFTF
jgi:hypothetical protein